MTDMELLRTLGYNVSRINREYGDVYVDRGRFIAWAPLSDQDRAQFEAVLKWEDKPRQIKNEE